MRRFCKAVYLHCFKYPYTPGPLQGLAHRMKRSRFDLQRRHKAVSLGDSIRSLLDAYQLRGRYNETRVISEWEKIMGTTVARHTRRLWLENRRLFAEITSAPLKAQLNMQKRKVKLKIEAYLNGEMEIEEVVFL